jgi:hypothetical protein
MMIKMSQLVSLFLIGIYYGVPALLILVFLLAIVRMKGVKSNAPIRNNVLRPLLELVTVLAGSYAAYEKHAAWITALIFVFGLLVPTVHILYLYCSRNRRRRRYNL